MSGTQVEVGILIGKLLQLAYSTDKGTTLKIFRSSGRFTLSVTDDGQASLKSSVGVVRFHGGTALRSFGIAGGPMEIRFSNLGGNRIRYTGTAKVLGVYTTIKGTFDIVKLITGCTGLVCEAARLLEGRHQTIESRIRRALGTP